MKTKKTLILGASPNPERYAFIAAQRLDGSGVPFVPVGIKKGRVLDQEILDLQQKPLIEGVDTITVYMNANRQKQWEDYLLSLTPKRIIFNPGAENENFANRARQDGIETLNACTLTMLATGLY